MSLKSEFPMAALIIGGLILVAVAGGHVPICW